MSRLRGNPMPARYMKFVNAKEALRGSFPHCREPAIIDGDVVWQLCLTGIGSEARTNYMIRHDLAKGVADMAWLLGEEGNSPVLGAARHASGDLAIVLFYGNVIRLRANGVVEALGRAPNVYGRLAGVAWAGDELEIVDAGREAADIWSRRKDGRWQLRQVPRPAVDAGRAAHLDFAERSADGWTMLWFLVGTSADDKGGLALEVVRTSEAHPAPVSIGRRSLSPAEQRVFGDADSWRDLGRALVETRDGAWQLAALAEPPPDSIELDLIVSGARPELVTRTTRSWSVVVTLRGRQLAIDNGSYQVRIHEVGGRRGALLAREARLSHKLTLAPASDGNLWVMGHFGAYVKATPELRRADPYGVRDRILARYESFEHWRMYDDDYVENESLQKASLPIALLLLPATMLVAAAAWLALRRGPALRYFAVAALLYLIPAVIVLSAFWKITKHI